MAFDTSETLTQTDCVDELLPGTSLFHDQYRITRFINSGGFGITYLARDSLDREIVIKECFASSFAVGPSHGSGRGRKAPRVTCRRSSRAS